MGNDMNKAILLPGLLSEQPYQNVQWSRIPPEWKSLYQNKFATSLHHDYYQGDSFRARIFRHIIYIISYLKSLKESRVDYYAFSLSILASAIHEDILSFSNMIDIFFELESKIYESKNKYKLCLIVTDKNNLHTNYPLLKPCFIGAQNQLHHILCSDEHIFTKTMEELSINYILHDLDFPFHSSACPLHVNPIKQSSVNINPANSSSKIFGLDGENIQNIIFDINQIFTSEIQFTPSLKTYDYIGELASRAQLLSLLKDSFPGIEDKISFDVLESDN